MGCEQSISTIPTNSVSPQKRQKIIDFFEQFKPNFQFDSSIKIFRRQFNQFDIEKNFNEEQNLWAKIFQKFENYYLDKDEQLELLEFMAKLIKSRLKQKVVNKKMTFSKKYGQKLEEFQKRVIQKYQLCLKVFKYTSRPKRQINSSAVALNETDSSNGMGIFDQQYLKFNLEIQEAKLVAAKARQLCDENMDAFSLLSLYLVHAINSLLAKGKSLQEIQSLLLETLQKLEKIYPANKSNNQEEQLSKDLSLIDLTRVKYVQEPEIIVFSKFFKSHYQQLEDYIVEKAQKASEEEQSFVQLTKSICLEKGYAFKSGVKIASPKNIPSIERTIEKILSNDKFLPILKEWKRTHIDQGQKQDMQTEKEKNEPNMIPQTNKGLLSYVESEKSLIMEKVKEILSQEKSIQFTAKDLLRGKCMFKTVEDIAEAFEKLRLKIEKQGYSIYEVKDRLNKKTRDITVIINMKEVRAELQLCLKFDKTANEFNHKIYELMRSVKFTSITNLHILNEKWASEFFSQQLEVFAIMLKKSQINANKKEKSNEEKSQEFQQLKQGVEIFVQKYLQPEFLGINMTQFQTKSRANRIIEKTLNGLKSIGQKVLRGSFEKLIESSSEEEQQKENKQKQNLRIQKQPANLDPVAVKDTTNQVSK